MEFTNDQLKQLLGDSFKEDMSAEDIISAIGNSNSALEEKHNNEVNKLKGYISRANGEVAEYKRKYQEKLTDDEKKEAEKNEAFDAMKTELETLKRANAISEQASKLTAMGYTADMANEQATAMVDNDLDKVLEIQQAFLTDHDKQVKAKGMADMRRPSSGKSDTVNEETFSKMSLDERIALKQKDQELYEELRKQHFNY